MRKGHADFNCLEIGVGPERDTFCDCENSRRGGGVRSHATFKLILSTENRAENRRRERSRQAKAIVRPKAKGGVALYGNGEIVPEMQK